MENDDSYPCKIKVAENGFERCSSCGREYKKFVVNEIIDCEKLSFEHFEWLVRIEYMEAVQFKRIEKAYTKKYGPVAE